MSKKKQKPAGSREDRLRANLEARSKEELVEYLLSVMKYYPELGDELIEEMNLASDDTRMLIEQAQQELRQRTAQSAWREHWSDDSSSPDYSGLQALFERLLELGACEPLLEMGRDLFERGQDQVKHANDDEGETGEAIADCLRVVFQAVLRSGLPDHEKLLYAMNMDLADGYMLCEHAGIVLDGTWSAAAWSLVADDLFGQLKQLPEPKPDAFRGGARRERLCSRLVSALEAAGRGAEVVSLYEAEAPRTHNYERLVKRLMDDGRVADAVRWAEEGIRQTEKQRPVIARHLREVLRSVAAQRQNWPEAAAYRAEEFFGYPSAQHFKELVSAAGKANCEAVVRAGAIRFLETGVRPDIVPARKGSKSKAKPDWPLPSVADAKPTPVMPGPHLEVLVDIALAEGNPDEILRRYEALLGKNPSGEGKASQVAVAVAASHPDRAAQLYWTLADRSMQGSGAAYEVAKGHLRKLRTLLVGLKRDAEWQAYLARARAAYRRKRSLMAVLDELEQS